jgi:tRNA(Ile)-lysidine synthetase-like protein
MNTLSFWFSHENINIWFNASKTDDKYITDLFLDDLIITENKEDENNRTLDECLSDIILLDQISRHAARVYPDTWTPQRIEECTKKACKLTYSIIQSHRTIANAFPHNQAMCCFALMPLRHSKTLQNLNTCFYQSMTMKKPFSNVTRRFIQHTLIQLEDIITKEVMFNIKAEEPRIFDDILDPLCIKNKSPCITSDFFYREIENAFTNRDNTNTNTPIIISMSGGVDSNILAIALATNPTISHHLLHAVHINYGNRHTNSKEEALVSYICKLINIPLTVRKIGPHLRRSHMDEAGLRDVYEEVTKQTRFGVYKHVATLFSQEPPVVVLGHNTTDILENIITNITYQRYDNLSGMEHESWSEGCNIIRPFLKVDKELIIKTAISHNIPFTYNSTPPECCRGKIRNSVIPTLNSYDPYLIQGLLNLPNTISSMNKDLKQLIKNHITPSSTLIPLSFMKSHNMINTVFDILNIHISKKSLINLKEAIDRKRNCKVILSKKVSVFLQINDQNIKILKKN